MLVGGQYKGLASERLRGQTLIIQTMGFCSATTNQCLPLADSPAYSSKREGHFNRKRPTFARVSVEAILELL
jgi:hypothetical protein